MTVKIEPTTLHVAHWREGGLFVDAWCTDYAEALRLAKEHAGSVEDCRVPWPVLVPEVPLDGVAPW